MDSTKHGKKDTDRTATPEEVRSETRCPLALRAEVRTEDERATGYLLNVSRKGAFVATELPLDLGSVIKLDFVLPGGLGRVSLHGKVRFSRGEARAKDSPDANESYQPGAGVEFLNVSEEDGVRLERYCRLFLSLADQIERAAAEKKL